MPRLGLASLLLALGARRPRGDATACARDTFGLAGEGWPDPFERGVESLQCEYKKVDAAKIPHIVVNYYPSIETFRDYDGVNMIPERTFEFPAPMPLMGHLKITRLARDLEPWAPGVNGPKGMTKRIQLHTCHIPQEGGRKGEVLSIQRLGPLKSVGNYDYWQFGLHDLWELSKPLAEHPEGLMFTASFSGAVDANGGVLGHPPIHIHHIHITPTPGVTTKMNGFRCITGLDPQECYVPNLVVEQHGDYQCTNEDGGIDCLFEVVAAGHAKVINLPLDLEGEINDVRAKDSEPLEWWYQIVLRWFPRTSEFVPLSQHFIVGPGVWNTSDQRNEVFVFPVNTSIRSVYWYSGSMMRDGRMLRNKLHAHNTMFDRAFWFRGTSEDLGLRFKQHWPNKSFEPMPLEEFDVASFDELQALLLANVSKAAEQWDKTCQGDLCLDRRPGLICQSWVSNEDFVDPVSGVSFAYDRRAPCCCRPWTFYEGDIFTVVAFMAPLKTAVGPHMPYTKPPVANMHIHWLMTYSVPENESHYDCTLYTQSPKTQVWYPNDLSRYPVFKIMASKIYGPEGGLINMPLTPLQQARVGLVWTAVSLVPYKRMVLSVVAAATMLLSLCILRTAKRCRRCLRAKRVDDHCAAQLAASAPCPDGASKLAASALRYTNVVSHDE